MNAQKMLLNKIKQYDFSLKELNLYLDTHPNCRRALSMFAQYKKLRDEAVQEYNEKFGPLTPEQNTDTQHWSWINDPWPWERRQYMWQYEKKLQYPVNIKNPNPKLAKVIISQLGGLNIKKI